MPNDSSNMGTVASSQARRNGFPQAKKGSASSISRPSSASHSSSSLNKSQSTNIAGHARPQAPRPVASPQTVQGIGRLRKLWTRYS